MAGAMDAALAVAVARAGGLGSLPAGLDIQLPIIDGYTATRKIKADYFGSKADIGASNHFTARGSKLARRVIRASRSESSRPLCMTDRR